MKYLATYYTNAEGSPCSCLFIYNVIMYKEEELALDCLLT